jgi:hypothetical protein
VENQLDFPAMLANSSFFMIAIVEITKNFPE